jgi:hypothetical protein
MAPPPFDARCGREREGKQEVKRKGDEKTKRLRAGERGDKKERRWCLCSFQGLKGET